MSTVTLEQSECKLVELPEGSKDYKLDARFRCDHSACEAQSYVIAKLQSGGELYFCNHHAHAVAPKLKPLCKEWYTEESRLREDRKKGSEN